MEREQGREDRDQDQHDQHDQTGERDPIPAKATGRVTIQAPALRGANQWLCLGGENCATHPVIILHS